MVFKKSNEDKSFLLKSFEKNMDEMDVDEKQENAADNGNKIYNILYYMHS